MRPFEFVVTPKVIISIPRTISRAASALTARGFSKRRRPYLARLFDRQTGRDATMTAASIRSKSRPPTSRARVYEASGDAASTATAGPIVHERIALDETRTET